MPDDAFLESLNNLDVKDLALIRASSKAMAQKFDDAVEKGGFRFSASRALMPNEVNWLNLREVPFDTNGFSYRINNDWFFDYYGLLLIPDRFKSPHIVSLEEWRLERGGADMLHRVDGPALVAHHDSGEVTSRYWFQNGKLHRAGGKPAIVVDGWKDGRPVYNDIMAWYENGVLKEWKDSRGTHNGPP